MTTPIERLRVGDPAAALGPQPDERAEADLLRLLAEPVGAGAAPAGERRPFVPVLVTAVVAVVLLALTVAVLGAVRPRVDVGGTTAPTNPPPVGTVGCRPAQVLPFQCGTYESTYGGKAITGDLGGPAKDRLRISFTQQHGALLLTASTVNCFAERVLVRYDGKRLVRIGKPQYAENDCHGLGADRRSWAYTFLNGPLELTGTDGPYFGSGPSSVFFEYQGAAPIGQPQLPRNDPACVPAHVAPFSCGNYRSTSGTGALAFLSTAPFRLGFDHLNGQLTSELDGSCNAMSVALEPDGATVVAIPGGMTAMGCFGDRGRRDQVVGEFFRGVLRYRIDRDRITFTKGAESATFAR